jgi:hypothetical protein
MVVASGGLAVKWQTPGSVQLVRWRWPARAATDSTIDKQPTPARDGAPHLSGGKSFGVVDRPGDSKVSKQNPSLIVVRLGQHDIGGFDIAVEKAALVCVVQRAGHSRDDVGNILGGHAYWVAALHQLCCIEPIDVIHCDPKLSLILATVMHPDDVGMPQTRRQVSFPNEPVTEAGVGRDIAAKNLQGVLTRQARMLK